MSKAKLKGASGVSSIMSQRLLTVRPKDSTALAAQMMIWSSVRHLPVVDGEELVGIVSDRDLLKLQGGVGTIADIMSKPHTATPSTTIDEAAAQMAAEKIDCLPVVEGRKLVGLVTSTDILADRGRLGAGASKLAGPTAEDIMAWDLVSTTPGATLLDAVETMLVNDVRHLPVIDSDGTAIGIVSERDLRASVGDLRDVLDLSDRSRVIDARVESVMTPNPTCVPRDAPIEEVAAALVDQRIGAVLVVDDADRAVGVVSYVDVLAHLLGREPVRPA